MSLLDAVVAAGSLPRDDASQAQKKRYSEVLSKHLALEVAAGLHAAGLPDVRPLRDGTGERVFLGGLGPKRVDVSFADDRNGLHLAVSIKTICFPPYGKNLKNRFGDLCTDAMTLHMRFPFSVVNALFAMPNGADEDVTERRVTPTFRVAAKLFGTISGRQEYTDAGEKFENVTMLLFQPVTDDDTRPWVRLIDAQTRADVDEAAYFIALRDLYNYRNPYAAIGDDLDAPI